MSIDFNKPLQTRDGDPVRILCTDAQGYYPVLGLRWAGDEEHVERWTKDGKFYADSEDAHCHDLVHVPQPRPHAELIAKWAQDDTVRIKYRPPNSGNAAWKETRGPGWVADFEYAEILPGDPLY